MLEIKNLTQHYDRSVEPTLKNISLNIQQGEFVAILGLSGAGKSTLIRTINGLVIPSNGEINVNGVNLVKASEKERRNIRKSIGMIFQSFNLIERLNVLSNVLLGRIGSKSLLKGIFFLFNKKEKEEAIEILNRVGLINKKYFRADELSGGQKQRVAIARTLFQKPKIILGDEPVSSLDPKNSEEIMNLLKNINQKDNITIIVNLHDVELAKKYCSRIIGISNGEIVFDNHVKELDIKTLNSIYWR